MDLNTEFRAALAAHREGRRAEAEAGFRAVVAHVEHVSSLHNLGIICSESGRPDEAAAFLARAAAARPDDAEGYAILGLHLWTFRRFGEAETAYRRAIALDPEAPGPKFELACVLLAMGRMQEGWTLYENRDLRRRVLAAGLSFPEWQGEPLAGKSLLIWREQGYGDQLMMARFLDKLGAAAITYAGPPALARLFARLPLDYDPVDPAADYAPQRHDYWTLPLSLPHRLGAFDAHSLPGPPYLSGKPARSDARIGVAWRGEAKNLNDRFRTPPPEVAAQLLALPGAISLDPADTGAADFQATADLIAGLDLVIAVDSAIAHLAGAMGWPLWVLLAKHALDWQWPREGTSPWYPQARLFVQETPGDWAPLVEAVRREAQSAGLG